METFVCGDPRILSGGGCRPVRMNYGNTPTTIESLGLTVFDTARAVKLIKAGTAQSAIEAAQNVGQAIHCGKGGYHSTPAYNMFLHDGEWPSAGVELETIMRRTSSSFAAAAVPRLGSNWFHFERDGSLDQDNGGEFGYELITEPLPPRVYRNPEVWRGLQNLIAPWLKSYDCPETGLHVHVGLNQFEGFDAIPIADPASRRAIGKLLSAIVYYTVAGPSFVDRVVLRKPGNYCNAQRFPAAMNVPVLLDRGRATGAELVDHAVSTLVYMRHESSSSYQSAVNACVTSAVRGTPIDHDWCDRAMTVGHGTEINQEHKFTIEFRRGKGTIHSLSVHRIVELMTSIVRYAGKICREPQMEVSSQDFMEWLVATTKSPALAALAKQHIHKKGN